MTLLVVAKRRVEKSMFVFDKSGDVGPGGGNGTSKPRAGSRNGGQEGV